MLIWKVSDAHFILILLCVLLLKGDVKKCSNVFSFLWTDRSVLNKRYQSLHV